MKTTVVVSMSSHKAATALKALNQNHAVLNKHWYEAPLGRGTVGWQELGLGLKAPFFSGSSAERCDAHLKLWQVNMNKVKDCGFGMWVVVGGRGRSNTSHHTFRCTLFLLPAPFLSLFQMFQVYGRCKDCKRISWISWGAVREMGIAMPTLTPWVGCGGAESSEAQLTQRKAFEWSHHFFGDIIGI